MPASAARRATGLGSRCSPRPAGASGRVTTAATSCPDFSRASSAGTAACGVPANTSRIGNLAGLSAGRVRRGPDLRHGLAPPLGLADSPVGQLALLRVEPVDEQHAVEMVGLVLHATRQLPGALD